MTISIVDIKQVLPTTERDEKVIEQIKERGYGFVYTEDGQAMRIVSKNLPENTYTVQLNEIGDTKVVSIDDVSVVPNDTEFEDYKKTLHLFETYDENGNFNMDNTFHDMFSDVEVVDSVQDIEDRFTEQDVFITNDTALDIVFNKKDGDFFVVGLLGSHYVDSLNLALKNNYEFNKSLPEY